ncbi:MAG: undecaprenyldiphospho-muramoylpentapeptide beta-N-acetylglucosaminyltransferase [Pseudomonadota bacterium]
MPKIMIMAGGTGGHIFPGLAVAEALTKMHWSVEWIGTADRMEAQIVPAHDIPLHTIDIKGARGKGLLGKFDSVWRLVKATLQAKRILKATQPDVVLGMGGYASGPGGIATKLLGFPLIVHEQNAIFGLTNRFLAKIARRVFTGFNCQSDPQKARAPQHTQWVGNPVRELFFDIEPLMPFEKDAINILITGGSLGAQALNEKLPAIINAFGEKHRVNVVHQCGKDKEASVARYAHQGKINIVQFIDDVASMFEWADIIICRAGALTVAEVAAAGRPAIFVPLPIAVDDHQTANAIALAKNNAAFIVQQTEIEQTMMDKLMVLANPQTRVEMGSHARNLAKKDAAQKIADFCSTITTEGSAA